MSDREGDLVSGEEVMVMGNAMKSDVGDPESEGPGFGRRFHRQKIASRVPEGESIQNPVY